jgi:hypothetical protein
VPHVFTRPQGHTLGQASQDRSYIFVEWTVFPIVFLLAPTGLGLIGAIVANLLYLLLDIYAKIVFNIQLGRTSLGAPPASRNGDLALEDRRWGQQQNANTCWPTVKAASMGTVWSLSQCARLEHAGDSQF